MRIDGSDFIEVDPKGQVTLKYDQTGREHTLIGPALARGCQAGDSVLALSRGSVETARGAGMRPGIEAGIATSAGALTYGDARILVRATGRNTTIQVLQGEAKLLATDDAAPARAERRLASSTAKEALAVSGSAESLSKACALHAKAAGDLAQAILGRKPASPRDAGPGVSLPSASADSLGSLAAQHVRARRLARMRCAMAMAALGNMPNAADRELAAKKLAEYDALWRHLKQLR
jgi:hypothetical protein